jgi:ATP-dependent RNA helicase DDX47/RRP3
VLQGFSLKAVKHLVLDEADKLLDMDFEQEIDQILKVRGRRIAA